MPKPDPETVDTASIPHNPSSKLSGADQLEVPGGQSSMAWHLGLRMGSSRRGGRGVRTHGRSLGAKRVRFWRQAQQRSEQPNIFVKTTKQTLLLLGRSCPAIAVESPEKVPRGRGAPAARIGRQQEVRNAACRVGAGAGRVPVPRAPTPNRVRCFADRLPSTLLGFIFMYGLAAVAD